MWELLAPLILTDVIAGSQPGFLRRRIRKTPPGPRLIQIRRFFAAMHVNAAISTIDRIIFIADPLRQLARAATAASTKFVGVALAFLERIVARHLT